jgi:hypothetical protein
MEPWVIALVSCAFSICITLVGAIYWFGRNSVTKEDLIAATATMTTEIHSLRGELDNHERNIGETFLSVRQKIADVEHAATKKITEVELYVRDTFVRRDSWHSAMTQMQAQWSSGEVAAEQRSLRLEAKVDSIIVRLMDETR